MLTNLFINFRGALFIVYLVLSVLIFFRLTDFLRKLVNGDAKRKLKLSIDILVIALLITTLLSFVGFGYFLDSRNTQGERITSQRHTIKSNVLRIVEALEYVDENQSIVINTIGLSEAKIYIKNLEENINDYSDLTSKISTISYASYLRTYTMAIQEILYGELSNLGIITTNSMEELNKIIREFNSLANDLNIENDDEFSLALNSFLNKLYARTINQ